MPQPTPSDVHVDAILTQLSIAYMQDQSKFVATRIFPAVSVAKQSDKYFTYNKNDWMRDEAKPRAPSTESAGGGFRLSTDNYAADVWAWHIDVDDQVAANSDSPLEPYADATNLVSLKMALRRERAFLSTYFTTGVWGTDLTVSTVGYWNDPTSNPEKQISDAKIAILKRTGFKPNVLLVSFAVHEALKQHPLIKDRYKHVSAESITAQMIAKFFEIDDYVISEAVYGTNVEGGTEAYDFTAGNHALLCYRNPSPGLRKPSSGYIFNWTGLVGSGNGVRIKRFRMEPINSDRIEGEMAFDHKVTGADLGYFFNGAIA